MGWFSRTTYSTNLPAPPSVLEAPEQWIFKLTSQTLSFNVEKVLGQGTFGVVYLATNLTTHETVAIKRTTVTPDQESLEVSMLHQLRHRNIVSLKHAFTTGVGEDRHLFIVTEFVSCDLRVLIYYYRQLTKRMMDQYVMVYMYQLLKGVSHIHSRGIAHRDLKPSNLLINLSNHSLKICDFGSARFLSEYQKNASYICSRPYRAPELLMGCQYYTTSVDIWSCGCIFAELYLGKELFSADHNVDQLTVIETFLGSPTDRDLRDIGTWRLPFIFRTNYPQPWRFIFRDNSVGDLAIDLLSKMLTYSPKKRINAETALRHPFFDPIRSHDFTLPMGDLPQLFDSDDERVC